MGQLVALEPLRRLEQQVEGALSRGEVPADVSILGWGEISVVLGLEQQGQQLACKRMPAFPSSAAVARYRESCARYVAELRAAGLRVPEHQVMGLEQQGGTVYYVQQGLSPESMLHKVLHRVSAGRAQQLLGRAMQHIVDVALHNRGGEEVRVGLDGQASNWALPADEDHRLWYIDCSTPLIRLDGVEQLQVELLLASLPPPLVPLVRLFYLREILDRYYDVRQVLRDLLGNLIKERLQPLVPPGVEQANELLASRLAAEGHAPLSVREVERYYRGDARMWEVLLRLRRMDRWFRRHVLRRPYGFLLPDAIER